MINQNMETLELEKIASQVRRDILRMVSAVNSGHPGGSLGCADFLTVLYFDIMNHNAANFSMDGLNEDIFFLSNGHISPVWYSVLARSGYFPASELGTFRKLGSRLQGHPSTDKKLPGIRMASGSLGQGLSVAVGTANAKKLNKDKSLVFTLHGDGELQEGQIWEALMYAAANKVDNLIATIDYNGRQIDGDVDDVLSLGNLHAKFTAFGWEVLEMDGHNIDELKATLRKAISMTGNLKPIVIIMKTEMGQGVDFMIGSHKWHGVAPNPEQLENALGQLTETLGDY
jgi:transketolase